MIKWILDNKDWIFSGVGVSILAVFTGWFYRHTFSKLKKKETLPTDRNPEKKQTISDETHYDRLFDQKRQDPSKLLKDYNIVHTPECLEDLRRMSLTQEELFSLVQSEFRSHLNYFRFDLEDYMMPVKASKIVYMDKVGNSLTFKRVFPCTKNEAKLSSWDDILTIYRRARRLPYRESPKVLFTQRGQFGRSASIHLDIEARVIKYFKEYEALNVDPNLFAGQIALAGIKSKEDIKSMEWAVEKGLATEIAFHLLQSNKARNEGYDIVQDLDRNLRTPETAASDLVLCLERSLQHLHKILILCPPSE